MATVLIIDDDQTMRALIGIAVEELGHHPTYAHDGEEGVNMISAQPYDLVFMDLAMPHKNGLVAIQEIIQEFPGTKIIAISRKDTEMLERAVEYGAPQNRASAGRCRASASRQTHGRMRRRFQHLLTRPRGHG